MHQRRVLTIKIACEQTICFYDCILKGPLEGKLSYAVTKDANESMY